MDHHLLDPYFVVLAVVGVAIIGTAVLRRVVTGLAVSLPMLYLTAGMALFALPIGLQGPRPGADDQAAERLTELIVIVSLLAAGLKINRPLGWRSWQPTWRLIGVAMPLTIGATALLGLVPVGLTAGSALLLGAVLAPTDPVLASEVQVEGPADDETADDQVRFTLTSEAGLNDGFAFPFTHLAIAVAGGGSWLAGWLVEFVFIRLTVGVVAGVILGRAIAWLLFSLRPGDTVASSGEGFAALGATLAVYGLTELIHGYGFLAVFIAGLTIRSTERNHAYHQALHDSAEVTEQLASIVFLLLLGGAVVDGGLSGLTPAGLVVAFVIVVVIRPISGWLSLLGTSVESDEKAAISFLGLRGMGTIYYLGYAASDEGFPQANRVWAVAISVIIISIVLHGTSSAAVLRNLDRRRGRNTALTT